MKTFIIFCIISVICAMADENEYYRILDSIHQEIPCSKSGGICTIGADCPEGRLTEESGLCPEQRSKGVECCYGVSVRDTRCQKHGGSCYGVDNMCNERLLYRQATDCPEGTKCCIMV